jgi:hypothetical protein
MLERQLLGTNEIMLDISSLKPGFYLVTVTSGKGTATAIILLSLIPFHFRLVVKPTSDPFI